METFWYQVTQSTWKVAVKMERDTVCNFVVQRAGDGQPGLRLPTGVVHKMDVVSAEG